MDERWLPVVGYEGLYEVSDLGRVRKVFGYVLKQGRHVYGYPMVSLFLHGKHIRCTVHRLVAEAFIGPRPGPARYDVHHRNDDPADSRLENLEYVTHAQNIQIANDRGHRTGRPKGSRSPRPHKLTEEQVREIKFSSEPTRLLMTRFNISRSMVKQIRSGKTWGWVN